MSCRRETRRSGSCALSPVPGEPGRLTISNSHRSAHYSKRGCTALMQPRLQCPERTSARFQGRARSQRDDIRQAKVYMTGSVDERTIAQYLPGNYSIRAVVQDEYPCDSVIGTNGLRTQTPYVIVEGEDVAGWTLDGYLIPRLASGLVFAEEIEVRE